jgi:hypothetical protein
VPGVLNIHGPRKRTQSYVVLGIPDSVAKRVHARLANGGGR